MAVYTHADTAIWSSADNTALRTRITNLRAALTSLGIVRTTDTGQVNEATITNDNLTASSNDIYYDVFRFNDALQATRPVFFKVFYKLGSWNNRWLVPKFVFGTASNGAGTLSGIGGTAQTGLQTTQEVNTTVPALYSGSAGGFTLATATNSYIANFISVERSKDANGNDTGDGLNVHWAAYSGDSSAYVMRNTITSPLYPYQSMYFDYVGAAAGATENQWNSFPPTAGNGTSGSNIYTYPIFPYYNFELKNPLKRIQTVKHSVLTVREAGTFVDAYEVSGTFIALGGDLIQTRRGLLDSTILMRYE